jgi:hypothetical protein
MGGGDEHASVLVPPGPIELSVLRNSSGHLTMYHRPEHNSMDSLEAVRSSVGTYTSFGMSSSPLTHMDFRARRSQMKPSKHWLVRRQPSR